MATSDLSDNLRKILSSGGLGFTIPFLIQVLSLPVLEPFPNVPLLWTWQLTNGIQFTIPALTGSSPPPRACPSKKPFARAEFYWISPYTSKIFLWRVSDGWRNGHSFLLGRKSPLTGKVISPADMHRTSHTQKVMISGSRKIEVIFFYPKGGLNLVDEPSRYFDIQKLTLNRTWDRACDAGDLFLRYTRPPVFHGDEQESFSQRKMSK